MVRHIIFGSYVLVAVLTTLLCVPLIKGRVGPNAWYGIRVPTAYVNDYTWYRMNRRGGWIMLGAALAMTLLAAVVYPLIAWSGLTTGALIGASLPVLPLLFAMVWIMRMTCYSEQKDANHD